MKMWVNVHTAQGLISVVSFDLELWTLFWIAQKQCCLCGTERGRHEVLTSLCLKTQRLLSQHKRLPVDSTFYRADLMKRERAWLQILCPTPPPPLTHTYTPTSPAFITTTWSLMSLWCWGQQSSPTEMDGDLFFHFLCCSSTYVCSFLLSTILRF